ncbi:hypothetical protein [Vibrio parahaemolyticus]|uniref:hypothetical protein n=1 Tax=Vibrio parahaemolyticus TaxID=670 RepID=UPI00301C9B66|nr:hypothetical protein [Vibrio parahaemolyticus]
MEALKNKKSFDVFLLDVKEARSLVMSGTCSEAEHDYHFRVDRFIGGFVKRLSKLGSVHEDFSEDFQRASELIEEAREAYPMEDGAFVPMVCYTKISEAIKVLHKIDEQWDADIRADLEERRLGILEGIDFEGVYVFASKKDGIEYVPTDMPDESHVEFTSKDGSVMYVAHWKEIEEGAWVQIK